MGSLSITITITSTSTSTIAVHSALADMLKAKEFEWE